MAASARVFRSPDGDHPRLHVLCRSESKRCRRRWERLRAVFRTAAAGCPHRAAHLMWPCRRTCATAVTQGAKVRMWSCRRGCAGLVGRTDGCESALAGGRERGRPAWRGALSRDKRPCASTNLAKAVSLSNPFADRTRRQRFLSEEADVASVLPIDHFRARDIRLAAPLMLDTPGEPRG